MVDENEFFREVTLRICSSLDIKQALSHVFEYIQKFVPADTIGLGYSDLTSGQIRVVAKIAQMGAQYIWKDGSSEIMLSNNQAEYVRTQPDDRPSVRIINGPDDQPDDPLHKMFPGLSSNSALFLTLDIHGEEFGGLLMSANGPNRYSAQDAVLIEKIREPFTIAMINARRYRELEQMKDLLTEDNRALSDDIKRTVGIEVVGADFGLRDVMDQVRQIAPSNSPTLLLGETGTGKEVIANAIHMSSPRSKEPMISMQCGAIPDTLLDSELFGHEKGAFTGASERKRGRFERAHGGTLFLDEIGELSPEAQVKLLRILQEHCFERVGGTKTIKVDVRVITATHRDLEKMVREGQFREDLWYRLNVLPIRIPPLRLRREDIPSLVHHFIKRKANEMNLLSIPRVDNHAIERLKIYGWPGNIRELQNIVERAIILSRGGQLTFPELGAGSNLSERNNIIGKTESVLTMDQAIENHIRLVLERTGGRIKGKEGAAELLKMNPSTLRFRIKKLGIK